MPVCLEWRSRGEYGLSLLRLPTPTLGRSALPDGSRAIVGICHVVNPVVGGSRVLLLPLLPIYQISTLGSRVLMVFLSATIFKKASGSDPHSRPAASGRGDAARCDSRQQSNGSNQPSPSLRLCQLPRAASAAPPRAVAALRRPAHAQYVRCALPAARHGLGRQRHWRAALRRIVAGS